MIKIYKGDYDRSEFYSLIGKFFAESIYKKELPYLTNRDNTVWHVLLKDGCVKAFSAYEESNNKICFKSDYYTDNVDDLEEVIKYKLNDLKDINKDIETATRNESIKKLFVKYGFKEYKSTSNYCFLIKESINE